MNIYKFTNNVKIISGGTPNTKIKEYWNGNIPWLSIADFKDVNKYVINTDKKITSFGLKNSATKMLNKNDIILSARGTIGALAILACPMAFNQSCFGLTSKDTSILLNEYIYYYLKNYIKILKYKKEGSVFGTIDTSTFDKILIKYPPIKEQQSIIKILSLLDYLIDIKNNINSELEQMAKTLYNYWFVQFDFPDENGKPYKSSGGKMVWNEELKKEIPEGWEVKYVKDTLDVITGNEDVNFTSLNGQYPFFSCSKQTLKCNEYAFDGHAVLIAGNGDFNVKAYIGKFNAYQRTYILIPNDNIYFALLYQSALNIINKFKFGANGAIIKFIKKSDVENIPLIIPKNKDLLHVLNNNLYFQLKINHNIEELTSLRDFLLPLLMNGQAMIED